MSEFNPFVNDFNKLRNFARLFCIYGCYSRYDTSFFKLSKRTFDDELRRMRIFLGESRFLKVEKEGKKQLPSICQEFFRDIENPLVNLYFSKTSTPLQTTLFFLILQILSMSKGYKASLTNIRDVLFSDLFPEFLNRDIDSSIRRALKDMEAEGIVEHIDDEKVYALSNLTSEIFSDFSKDELKDLYIAVLFFINAAVPNVPGWYLKESLEKYLIELGESEFLKATSELFWFTYVPNHSVLDENLVWQFIDAVSNKKKIKVSYYPRKKQESENFDCVPLKIIYDVKLGRWYFIVLKDNDVATLPAGRVKKIEILDDNFEDDLLKKYHDIIEKCFFVSVPKKVNSFKRVKLKFVLDKESSFNFVLNRVKRELKNCKIEILNNNEFTVEYDVSNLKEFKPWLRSFCHRATILDGDSDVQKLKKEMIEEWKEILKSYGSI